MTVTSLAERLLHLVLPARCLGCGQPGGIRSRPLGLCPSCRGRLEPCRQAPHSACAGCARPLAGHDLPEPYWCGECRRQPPAFDRLVAGWTYAPPLDEVIRALKFRRLDYLGGHLGTALGDLLPATLGAIDAVVPVPLHWRRRWARGYNQAELIARPLAARLGLPLRRALRRRRGAAPQATLPQAARRRNLKSPFVTRGSLSGACLLLVDDVVTTGATLRAAAACLRTAGAGTIIAVVVARTPRESRGEGERWPPVGGRDSSAGGRRTATRPAEPASAREGWPH